MPLAQSDPPIKSLKRTLEGYDAIIAQMEEVQPMADQPEHTPRGQWAFNTGATPPKSAITRVSKAIDPNNRAQNMKGIHHTAKMDRHNSGLKGN